MLRIKTVLAALAALIALAGYIPLAPYLGLFPRLLLPAALLFGYLSYRRGYLLPGYLVNTCAVLFFLFYAVQVSGSNLVGPAADLLAVLLAMRLAGEQSGRHYLQTYVLSVFCLSASTLFSLDSMFLVYLLFMLPAVAVSLVLLSFIAVDPDAALSGDALGKVLRVAILLPAGSVPLALVFFVILPRSPYAMWNFLNQQTSSVVGFSEKVQPGRTSSQSEVKTLAFRAETGRLPDNLLYWRGIVLNRFNGTAWERSTPTGYGIPASTTAQPVIVTVYPEPTKSRFVITLNMPRQLTGMRATPSADAVFTRVREGVSRTRYQVTALPEAQLKERLGPDRAGYLQVPPGLSASVDELARSVAADAGSGREILDRLEKHFRRGRFMYVTSGLPTGAHSLDTFLFDQRKGNCEFFASSLALLLRKAGVPARLVGGYLGGEYNDLGGYYAVTEDRAHVWVEANLDGSGWTTVDPSRWAVNAGERALHVRGGLFARLRLAVDAMEYFWTRSVIAYDMEKQLEMMRSAGRRWNGVKVQAPELRSGLVAAVLLLVVGIVYANCFRRRLSPEEKLVGVLFTRLRKQDRLPANHACMGLYRIADYLQDPAVKRFAELYGAAVYHDRALSSEEYRELRMLVLQTGKGVIADGDRGLRRRTDDS